MLHVYQVAFNSVVNCDTDSNKYTDTVIAQHELYKR